MGFFLLMGWRGLVGAEVGVLDATEGKAEDDVLVWLRRLPPLVASLGNRRVHVVADLVSGEPELGRGSDGGGRLG